MVILGRFAACVAALVFGVPMVAHADIARHCDGWYHMDLVEENGRPVSRGEGYDFGDFSGRGTCGRTVPNRCRERARNNLRECYQDHWAARWDRERPSSCTQSSGVKRYTLTDIKQEMERLVCCDPDNASRASAVVDLYGATSGDNGCGARIVRKTFKDWQDLRAQMLIQEGYKMQCSTIRAQYCPGLKPKRANPN